MVEWFKAAVLKTAEAQVSEGSNPSLSAIFLQKNGERSRKASLHAATAALHSKGAAFSSLPRRNEMKPGHLHQTPETLLACLAIALATADEVVRFALL